MHVNIALSSDVKAKARVIATSAPNDAFIGLWFDGEAESVTFALPLRGAAGADYARQLAQSLDDAADQLDRSLAAAANTEGVL